jgi:hypothetical protein
MDSPYYFRDTNYQYKLQSHTTYGFRVGRSETSQAIWWVNNGYLEIIWFDSSGKFESTEGISNTVYVKGDKVDDSELLFKKACDFMQQKFGLRDETISVERFWLPELEAGIEDLTDTMKEFLNQPESFSDEEKDEYPGLIEEWKKDNDFVLWWGQDFYVNGAGFIETS